MPGNISRSNSQTDSREGARLSGYKQGLSDSEQSLADMGAFLVAPAGGLTRLRQAGPF